MKFVHEERQEEERRRRTAKSKAIWFAIAFPFINWAKYGFACFITVLFFYAICYFVYKKTIDKEITFTWLGKKFELLDILLYLILICWVIIAAIIIIWYFIADFDLLSAIGIYAISLFIPGILYFYKKSLTKEIKGKSAVLLPIPLKILESLPDSSDKKAFQRRIELLKSEVQKESASSMYTLGLIYYSEKGIQNKRQEGRILLLKSAKKQYFPAVKILPYLGISDQSIFYLLDKISQKIDPDPEVYVLLSRYYLQDYDFIDKDEEEAVRLLKLGAKKGNAEACLVLANIYFEGKYGVSKDISEAISYYEKSVAAGNSQAMVELAQILENSEDHQDLKKAFDLYKKSADLNNGMAYFHLGECYKNAIGTIQNSQKALDYYYRAAELNCFEAFEALYLFYINEECICFDISKAVEWLQKGDNAGVPLCTYQLASHYKDGIGVEQNLQKYFLFLKKSAQAGYKKAYKELADCYLHGIGTSADEQYRISQFSYWNHLAYINNC